MYTTRRALVARMSFFCVILLTLVSLASDRSRAQDSNATEIDGTASEKGQASDATTGGDSLSGAAPEEDEGPNASTANHFGEFSPFLAVKIAGDAKGVAESVGATIRFPIQALPGWYVLEFAGDSEALESRSLLLEIEEVEEVLLQPYRPRVKRSNDTLYGQQWHLENTAGNIGTPGVDVGIVGAWSKATGNGVTLAMMDDGFDTAHPDMAANFAKNTLHFDFLDNDNDPSPELFDDDHGTTCAGLAGAVKDNAIGVAGTGPDVSLVGIRMLGASTDASDAAAIGHQNNSIHVYSNSWGFAEYDGGGPLFFDALDATVTNGRSGRGCIVVFAAGNDGDQGEQANADLACVHRGVIVVGALAENGEIVDYSEPGENMTVVAPTGDGNITTTDRQGGAGQNDGFTPGDLADGDYTQLFSGTSASCPMVSGICALMLEANSLLTWRDVQHILVETSEKVDAGHSDWTTNIAGVDFNRFYGFGLIDADAAVSAAQGWTLVDAAVTPATATSAPNLAIPDNDTTGVSSTVNIGENISIEHVMVELDSDHTNWTELQIDLISPGGTRSALQQATGLTGAAPGASGFPDPNTWTFRSNRFWGETSYGDWRLEIVDTLAADTGSLVDWTLTIHGTDAGAVLAPVVTQVSPTTIRRGEELTISGDNLVGASVTVGGINHTATYNSGALTLEIDDTVPFGSQSVLVSNVSGSDSETITVEAPPGLQPAITSLTPNPVEIGSLLTISGDNLGGTSVTIGGVAQVASQSGNDWTLTVAVGTPIGTQQLVITATNGTTSDSIEILPDPRPAIESISPQPVGLSENLTISGRNLNSITSLTIGLVDLTIVSSSNTEIVATLPLSTPVGTQQLNLEVANGSTSATVEVNVPAHLLPTLDPLQSENLYYGDTLTLTGTNLLNARVTIGGLDQSVLSSTQSAVEFTVISGTATGSQNLLVIAQTGDVGTTVTIGQTRPVQLKSGGGGGGGCSISQSNGVGYAVLLLGMLIALSRRRRRLLE